MKKSFLDRIPYIPKSLDNEDMHCPRCFSVMVIVVCHHCGELVQVPVKFPT